MCRVRPPPARTFARAGTITELPIVRPREASDKAHSHSRMLLESNYFIGCVFYMIGSLSFVLGTGFFLADAVRATKSA